MRTVILVDVLPVRVGAMAEVEPLGRAHGNFKVFVLLEAITHVQ